MTEGLSGSVSDIGGMTADVFPKSSDTLRNGLFLPSKSLGGGIKESRVRLDDVSSLLVSPDSGAVGVTDCWAASDVVVDDGGVRGNNSWQIFWL